MQPLRKIIAGGVQSFEVMRTQDYLYVDKTRHIYRMVTEGTFYFLSRPRRFGKSLLVSTLKCLFQGRKELFEGLWIAEQCDWDWQEFPVITIDFNTIPGKTPEELQQGLLFHLKKTAQHYGITLEAPLLDLQFEELILSLAKAANQQVVIVIDEYDKRIIEHLGRGTEHLDLAKGNRDILKSIFGILKGQSIADKLRLVFITGFSRFSKVSLFSDLNNLRIFRWSMPMWICLAIHKRSLKAYLRNRYKTLRGRSVGRPPAYLTCSCRNITATGFPMLLYACIILFLC